MINEYVLQNPGNATIIPILRTKQFPLVPGQRSRLVSIPVTGRLPGERTAPIRAAEAVGAAPEVRFTHLCQVESSILINWVSSFITVFIFQSVLQYTQSKYIL